MNSLFNRFNSVSKHKGKKKRMLLSIVILFEAFLLSIVATYAWVETVSSIKITNETNTKGTVDTYVFTEAMIGAQQGTIDIAKYFKQAGDMHLAPASSADGKTMYFPKANLSSNIIYRKGNVSDKNTAYLCVTFKVMTDTNADFFFEQVPSFTALGDDIRVSVTSQSEGSTSAPVTTIYSNDESTTAVVNSTSGATGATTVAKYADHIKGKGTSARLFAVGANETKIVTINVWLQKKTGGNTDLTNNMSQAVTINNLGITSSLTPRHVTLLPTPEWDRSGETQYFYAWCWDASNGDADRLYKLELDENEHYSFDYNGTYRKTLFIRAKRNDLTTANMSNQWNTTYMHNKTADTTIPNDPVDPTYIIETINGGSYDNDTGSNKSTGSWHDPAIIKVAHTTNQTDTWGTLSATTYVGSTTSTHIIEQTNSNSQKHKDTVHAWPGKKIRLVAAAKTNYAFVGWYDNEEGTGTALSTSATYEPNAPSTAADITYFAKFKEVRTLTINRYVDGNASSTAAAGTITIGDSTSANNVTSYSKTVDKGSSVSFSATAAAGYTLSGIYTTANEGTEATSPITLNSNTTYYARFTANSYDVTARAYYSNDYGSTYTANDSTGGTVKAGSTEAGATSTASVKYKSTVSLVASPESGYEFVGWFSVSSGGSALSTNTTYTYTLNTAGAVNVYARFIKLSKVTIYIAPRENWGNPDVHVWDNNGVIGDHITADYDGSSGYYKVTVQTRGTWVKAILSKDNSYTDQTSDIEVVSSISVGTDYSKFINTSSTVSNWSSTKRCIWFIITEDWLKNNLKNDHDYMQVYVNNANTNMRRIDDYAYVVELSNPSGTIYFKQYQSNNNKRNEWQATIQSSKSQFKETSYNSGSWQ